MVRYTLTVESRLGSFDSMRIKEKLYHIVIHSSFVYIRREMRLCTEKYWLVVLRLKKRQN